MWRSVKQFKQIQAYFACVTKPIYIFGLGLDPSLSINRHVLPGFLSYSTTYMTSTHHYYETPSVHSYAWSCLSILSFTACEEKQAAVSHYLIELLQAWRRDRKSVQVKDMRRWWAGTARYSFNSGNFPYLSPTQLFIPTCCLVIRPQVWSATH